MKFPHNKNKLWLTQEEDQNFIQTKPQKQLLEEMPSVNLLLIPLPPELLILLLDQQILIDQQMLLD